MNIQLSVLNPEQTRYRVTIILCAALALLVAVSLVVFLFTEQWTKRVLFFPEVNSQKYAAEVRYLPNSDAAIDNIRQLLTDLLLGPSNFGNAPVLPPNTRLLSAMLEREDLYVGFSRDIFQTEDARYLPREMLQSVADTVYFNFPWVKNVYFFIGGKELQDETVFHLVDRKFDLARRLVQDMGDLSRTLDAVDRNPLFEPADMDRNVFLFHNGARWDDRILK